MRITEAELRGLIRETIAGQGMPWGGVREADTWEPGKRTYAGYLARLARAEERLIPLYLELERLNRLAAGMLNGDARSKVMARIPEVEAEIAPLRADLERLEGQRDEYR